MTSGKAVLRRALLGAEARAAARIAFALAFLAACAPPPAQPRDAASLGMGRYKAVLVAGDGSLPVFDDAVEGLARRLPGLAWAQSAADADPFRVR